MSAIVDIVGYLIVGMFIDIETKYVYRSTKALAYYRIIL